MNSLRRGVASFRFGLRREGIQENSEASLQALRIVMSAYDKLLNDDDRALLPWVARFHEYDLYSKADSPPDIESLKPYYLDLIDDFFPASVRW